jgi:biotin transporter BioY
MMAALLSVFAFVLILVGVFVQTAHHDSGVKFAVTWSTMIGALVFILFAGKVWFS